MEEKLHSATSELETVRPRIAELKEALQAATSELEVTKEDSPVSESPRTSLFGVETKELINRFVKSPIFEGLIERLLTSAVELGKHLPTFEMQRKFAPHIALADLPDYDPGDFRPTRRTDGFCSIWA